MLAALTTPPDWTLGMPGLVLEVPPITAVPVSTGALLCAVAVMETVVVGVFCGVQVPDQRPSSRLVRLMGASPEENDVITDPVVMGVPQSSTTVTSMEDGHAAEVTKFCPRDEKTGTSCVGAHPPA